MKLTLRFPKRGKPPADIPGYEREKGDPYVFHKIWPSCWLRATNNLCALYLKVVNQNDCTKCAARCPTESS